MTHPPVLFITLTVHSPEDAFGTVLTDTAPTTGWNFRHRAFGEVQDPNTGWIYLRARWMDPETGRFASRDPFGGSTGELRSFHRYAYAHLDPVNTPDPSGMCGPATPFCALALVGVAVILLSMSAGCSACHDEPDIALITIHHDNPTSGKFAQVDWSHVVDAVEEVHPGLVVQHDSVMGGQHGVHGIHMHIEVRWDAAGGASSTVALGSTENYVIEMLGGVADDAWGQYANNYQGSSVAAMMTNGVTHEVGHAVVDAGLGDPGDHSCGGLMGGFGPLSPEDQFVEMKQYNDCMAGRMEEALGY